MTGNLFTLKQAGGNSPASISWMSMMFSENMFNAVLKNLALPILGLACFLLVWQMGSKSIVTSLGVFPGPLQAYEQSVGLWQEHLAERERQSAFYQRQDERNAQKMQEDPTYVPSKRNYTGKPTFLDQIVTSLITVMSGFILASLIAIPLGIMIGLSNNLYAAINPLIQIFKPISPLAWLPLVTMAVSALYVSEDPMLPKSFINSMITVVLCSLWPTVINTAVGVSNVSSDLTNVSKVLRLNWFDHVMKIVLPASLPMMFTGLRLSLGIGWMVLIAAEMLAQNPGLGKFVWDEFQNGSSNSLGRIMVAVLVIGFIGYCLDRLMLSLQKAFSWDTRIDLK